MSREWQDLMRAFCERGAVDYREACWRPAADLYRTPRGWVVKFDLAGVQPEEVEVRQEGRRLTVAGVRRDRSTLETGQAYSLEIAYNRFDRSIELPEDFDPANVSLSIDYRDGMFVVRLETEGNRT